MSPDELELSFARAIVKVRDTAIGQAAIRLSPQSRGGGSVQRWRSAIGSADYEDVKREIIPDVVDSTLFHLLMAIDTNELELFVRDPDTGQFHSVAEIGGVGEMPGNFIGDDGWREAHSTEVVNSFEQ